MLLDPGLLDWLSATDVVGTESDELEAVRPGFESACDLRVDAYGVERSGRDDVVCELGVAAAVEDEVDLLGVWVAKAATSCARLASSSAA